MSESEADPAADKFPAARGTSSARARTLILVAELLFVGGLALVWLRFDSVRQSDSLWVLFLYSFPSEFLIAPVPHEPVFFYFGKLYSPILVAAVAVVGTVMTEALNYSVFGYFARQEFIERTRDRGVTKKLVNLFRRAPFTALLIGGLSPLPFYPLRFLVVLANYPIGLYLLAVFLSRAPRFYVLSLLGEAFSLPDRLLIAMFVVLIVGINGSALVGVLTNTTRAPRIPARSAKNRQR